MARTNGTCVTTSTLPTASPSVRPVHPGWQDESIFKSWRQNALCADSVALTIPFLL
jgi:hypothetical protein